MDFNHTKSNLNLNNLGKLIFEEGASLESSSLVDDELKNTLKLFVGEFNPTSEWKLLYRASDDGFKSNVFHEKCDNIPNTVSIIRSSNGYVFGGFTTQAWDSSGTNKQDENAFIFSMINQGNISRKFPIRPHNASEAIYCDVNCGPCFGSEDFTIFNDAYLNNSSNSNFGKSYKGGNSQRYLAGSYYFVVSEIEVFAITFDP